MDSSKISILPDDIIIAVATELRRSNSAHDDLSAFVLVEKRWYHIGIPLLYGNIGFSFATIERLRTSFLAEKFGVYVRSLTLHIRVPRSDGERAPSHAHISDNKHPITEEFAAVVPAMKHMTNLASFSLVLKYPWSLSHIVPRSVLVDILEVLPQSCHDLELDIGHESGRDDERVHVCNSIRAMLPRLRNLRIRIGTMCGAMFGIPNETGDIFKPVSMPKISSLVINCGYDGDVVEKCGDRDFGSAWPVITEALSRLLIQGNGVAYSGAKIYAMMNTDEWLSPPKIGVYGVVRVDMVAKISRAFPKWYGGTPATSTLGCSLCHIIRMQGYDIWAEDYDTIEAIAEGQLWRHIRGGGRLPVEVLQAEKDNLPSFGTGCVEKPLQTHKNWVEGGRLGWRAPIRSGNNWR